MTNEDVDRWMVKLWWEGAPTTWDEVCQLRDALWDLGRTAEASLLVRRKRCVWIDVSCVGSVKVLRTREATPAQISRECFVSWHLGNDVSTPEVLSLIARWGLRPTAY